MEILTKKPNLKNAFDVLDLYASEIVEIIGLSELELRRNGII
jgi:hypothetical protein